MNALAHCVEVAWSPHRTPEAEAIAPGRRAPASSTRCPRSSTIPTTSTPAPTCSQGAILAGRCLQNASMGVHHGLAQLVGGRTGIPHGLANAIVLPARHGASTPTPCPTRSAALADALGVDDATAGGRRPWSSGSACPPG